MSKIERPSFNDYCDNCKFKSLDSNCKIHRVNCGAVIECNSFKSKADNECK